MKIIHKIKLKIRRKLTHMVLFEMKASEKGDNLPYKFYDGFKSIGPNSFFWGKHHQISGINNCSIGENVHIGDNAFIRAEGGVSIGDNTHISRNLVLYSMNHDYNGTAIPYDEKMIFKSVQIGKNVWIGMNVCIAPGTIIGDGCIIGMGTTVSGSIPPLSIVTSPKCVVINKRNEKHYSYLEQEKRYGGPNGQLYNWGNEKSLVNSGDIYISRRSTTTLINFGKDKAIKKTYLNTPDGTKAFETEKLGYELFKTYSWCPTVYEITDQSITIEYINPETRLDLQKELSKETFGQIIWNLFELFCEGYAHRDFHGRNIFLTKQGIKFIDFETIEKIDSDTDFFESYDIIGKGLDSPYNTSNMGLMNKNPISVSQLFNVSSINEIKSILDHQFEKRMYNSSVTFKTLRNGKDRHSLQNPQIYSSFNLKNTKISIERSQRNTEKRLTKFRINKEVIQGNRILDIGSNIGATLLHLDKYDPTFMLGLEYDLDKVAISKKLTRYNNIKNVDFQAFDIEKDSFPSGKFEIIFCLAVIEHLINKNRLFELFHSVGAEVIYFEGNANSDIEFIQESFKKYGFTNIKYLGFSDDEINVSNNNRPLFIAKK